MTVMRGSPQAGGEVEVAPVFRHGRLRLYLLKLLDESPRHGYEVIRLLQDRFMGVYAPSPGTIYPRLARLEEDGLVTHEEVDGKKVYSITDKGREEIRSRLGDLADLEDELTESLRDVAREISEDVRDTVRSIREELTSAAREFRNSQEGKAESGEEQRPGESDEAHRIREEAKRNRDRIRASFRAQGRSHGDWAAWQERAGKSDGGWGSWADWIGGRDEWFGAGKSDGGWGSWADWIGGRDDWFGAGKSGGGAADEAGPAGDKSADSTGADGGKRSRRGSQNPFSDLERMALQFATELRTAAKQTGSLGERSLSDLRDILTDTLAKVRVEVFSDREQGESEPEPADGQEPGQDQHQEND
jgi:DNA-binding PadR family transcriptional regulator